MAGISDDLPKFRDELEVFKRISKTTGISVIAILDAYEEKKLSISDFEKWCYRNKGEIYVHPCSKKGYDSNGKKSMPKERNKERQFFKRHKSEYIDYDKAFYTNDF